MISTCVLVHNLPHDHHYRFITKWTNYTSAHKGIFLVTKKKWSEIRNHDGMKKKSFWIEMKDFFLLNQWRSKAGKVVGNRKDRHYIRNQKKLQRQKKPMWSKTPPLYDTRSIGILYGSLSILRRLEWWGR